MSDTPAIFASIVRTGHEPPGRGVIAPQLRLFSVFSVFFRAANDADPKPLLGRVSQRAWSGSRRRRNAWLITRQRHCGGRPIGSSPESATSTKNRYVGTATILSRTPPPARAADAADQGARGRTPPWRVRDGDGSSPIAVLASASHAQAAPAPARLGIQIAWVWRGDGPAPAMTHRVGLPGELGDDGAPAARIDKASP